MTISVSNLAGVNLTTTVAGTGTNSDEGNDFALGTIVEGTNGTEFMYVHASAAVTQYDVVGIDEDFEAAPLSKDMADDGWTIGLSQVAAADNDFFWVALKGAGGTDGLQANVLTSCAADVALYTSATDGSLDDSSTSQTKIDGIVAVTAVNTAGSTPVIATWPKSTTF